MTLTRVGRCPNDTTGSNASGGGAENFFKKNSLPFRAGSALQALILQAVSLSP